MSRVRVDGVEVDATIQHEAAKTLISTPEQAMVCATWPPSVSERGMLPHLGPSGHSNCVQSMLPVFL